MSKPTAADISQQMEKIESLVTTSKRLLEEGKMVDLGALEERIRALSEALNECGTQTAKPFLEPVQKLVDSLDGLEKGLIEHQQNLGKLQGDVDLKKAQNAYKKDE